MIFKLFQYALSAQPELDDLNRFLARHRVVSVQKELVQCRGEAHLIFIVEVLTTIARDDSVQKSPRIDYREQLDPEEFVVFCQLRDCRKALAEAEGVPVFTVFTNAQLASMVSSRCSSVAELASLPGVGHARVSKYGDAILSILRQAMDSLPVAESNPDQ